MQNIKYVVVAIAAVAIAAMIAGTALTNRAKAFNDNNPFTATGHVNENPNGEQITSTFNQDGMHDNVVCNVNGCSDNFHTTPNTGGQSSQASIDGGHGNK